MKTAIAIDSLLFRDDSTFLLELVLNLFPDSDIYTIVHKRGGILGPIETRPIVSSFLSHRTKNKNVIEKNFWILPSAVKGISFHSSIEKVIILSRGYIHGLVIPSHVEKYLYLLDWDFVDQKHLGWQKLFAPFVNDWRIKNLSAFSKIAVSSEGLKLQLSLPQAEVIYPTYRTQEYPFVKDEDHNFMFTHHLLLTHDLSLEEFKSVVSILLDKQETIRVLGPINKIESIISDYPNIDFVGDHCEATIAMYSHQAKVIWDLSQSFFPARALGALATGRPVVVRNLESRREFLGQGSYLLDNFFENTLRDLYHKIEETFMSFERRALRRAGLKWNERLFKSRIAKFTNCSSISTIR